MSSPAHGSLSGHGLPGSTRGRLAVLLCLAAVMLTGCASLRGSAQPVSPLRERLIAAQALAERPALAAFYAPSDEARAGLDKRSYRDMVVGIHVSAADARYDEFKAALSQNYRGTNAGSNLLVLLFNGLATVSSGGTARTLAAGSAVITGANATINKDIFFDKTLQALLASMDANRTAVKIRIRDCIHQLGPTEYSLGDAFQDIHELEGQADIDIALQQLTALAANDAQAQKKQLQASFQAPLLTPVLLSEVVGVRRYTDQLAGSAAESAQVHSIAIALGATDDPNSAAKTAANIRVWLAAHIRTQTDYEQLVDKLKAITRKDSYP